MEWLLAVIGAVISGIIVEIIAGVRVHQKAKKSSSDDIEDFKRIRNNYRIYFIITILLLFIVSGSFFLYMQHVSQEKYDAAIQSMIDYDYDYDKAAITFNSLGNFRDSKEKAMEAQMLYGKSTISGLKDVTAQFHNKTIIIKSIVNSRFASVRFDLSLDKPPLYAWVDEEDKSSKFLVSSLSGGWSSLQCIENKKYLSTDATIKFDVPIYANADRSIKWECFKIFKRDDEYYILSEANLNFLSVLNTGDPSIRPICANGKSASMWEQFKIQVVEDE